MAIKEIHVNDIGTSFEATLLDETTAVVNVAPASVMEIHFQKPTVAGVPGAVVVKTASLFTDGADGVIQYITVADDLDVAGTWKRQAFVTLPTGQWSSDISTFKVHKNLS